MVQSWDKLPLTLTISMVMGVNKASKLVPIVFKKRKTDVLGIVAVLNGKTVDEIANQNFLITAMQVKEIIKDKNLLDFFKSCAAMEGDE